uniref:L1 transposable element RRM domain-containing protein n=1 Tax=Acanthochromis polyacanthus TaxID=80966 RepID=A0A3Q1HCE3_9TELE
MANTAQKKVTRAVAQSLTSPALKQTLMANASSAACSTSPPSTTQRPEDSAVLQLVKDEMDTSRRLLSDIIKQEMASFRTEIKQDLESLPQDIKADIASLKTKFQVELASLNWAHSETAATVREMEGALNRHDSSITALEDTITELRWTIKKVKDRSDDLENRSQRQNLRIIGIPEGSENGKPTAYMASFFAVILGDDIADPLVLDRAHRSLAPKPKPGDRSRPMIVRLHYYSDKEKILQISKNKGEVKFRGTRVHIFPDMNAELSRRRAAFIPIKAKLRQVGITYCLHHPAELRLTCDSVSHSFKTPAAVEDFLSKRKPSSSAT